MSEPAGRGLPNPDSTGDLLAEWNIEDEASRSLLGSPQPGRSAGEPRDLGETTFRPSTRAMAPHKGESLTFLEEFSLGGPEEGESVGRRGVPGRPQGATDIRRDRPTGASGTIATGDDRRDRDPGASSSPPRSSRDLPGVGDVLAGFRILQELGRGAFARVYLAEEIRLGGRLVAIKVSRAEGDEPRILARLQHTNIVPVHSSCDDPESGLRVLCMPFFGGANLAQVLDTAGGLTTTGRAGGSLVDALDRISRRHPAAASEVMRAASAPRRSDRSLAGAGPPSIRPESGSTIAGGIASSQGSSAIVLGFRSLLSRIVGAGAMPAVRPAAPAPDDDPHQPALQFLRNCTAVQAAAWIVARLAEGLDHAHSRGLLHRDLKPANILLAADGTPMLLDFNLAAENPARSPDREIGRALVGGTLPYMAPEHLDAFSPRGSTPPEAVDERADIYALGLILHEVLAGESPFPVLAPQPGTSPCDMIRRMIEVRRRPPSLRARCPDVPWSLDALVARCLEFEPSRRYDRARDLAEDLRRFLDDLPLKHTPEPSLRERAGKFARRHRALCSSSSIALISLVFIVAMGTAVTVGYRGMQGLAARFQRQAFERDFVEAQFLLNTAGPSDRHLVAGLARARALFEQLELAEGRTRLAARWFPRLTIAEQRRVREQVVELMVLEARARVMLSSHHGTKSDRQAALERAIARLTLAARIADHVPSALFDERARYHAALGAAALAERDRRLAASARPATCHDWTLLGTTLLAAGDPRAAEDALRQALRLDCTSFRAWFMMGHCHYAQGRYLEAAGDFSACTVQGSHFAWVHFNRGLALARAGLLDSARDAYDFALRSDPAFAEALVNRALVELELNQLEPALADLSQAIELGRNDVAVLAARGEALARLGRTDEARLQFRTLLANDPDDAVVLVARAMTRLRTDPRGARDDFEHVIRLDPRHPAANYGLALLTRGDDPKVALRHLDTALDSDPHLADAIQLRALVRARLGDPAALDDVERLLKLPTARRYYNAACAVALYAEKAREPRQLSHAMELLARAVELGTPVADAAADPDLTPLRDLPAFRRLGQVKNDPSVAAR
jgi:serine/threonine protein kinase/tetratricopeptide (TPR) repeat protein